MTNSVNEQISGLFTKKAATVDTRLQLITSITGAGEYLITDNGVTLAKRAKEGEDPTKIKITEERLEITAIGRTQEKTDYSVLLEWDDIDGNKHTEIISKADLESEGKDIRRLLASGGLTIRSKAGISDFLIDYLRSCLPEERFVLVDRLGWQKNSKGKYFYVFSDSPVGDTEEKVIYRPEGDEKSLPKLEISGTWEEWRDNVAPLCINSTRGCLAVCMAFGAALFRLIDVESFGINFVGKTSRGKSTLLQLACSVYGVFGSYKKTWSATTTGLESIAYNHNDALLILDEMSQANPTEIAQIIYTLGNEVDKSRGSRLGGVRASKTWRIGILSTGEETISDIIRKCGRVPTAGLEVRLPSVKAQATDNEELGVNERFPEGMDAIKYKDYLGTMVKKYHGAVLKEWIKYLASQDPIQLKEEFRAYREKFINKYRPTAQNIRIAQNFAAAAFAGELATKAGLTGWPEIRPNSRANLSNEPISMAFSAVGHCFQSTLDLMGNALPIEDKRALEHIEELFVRLRGSFSSYESTAIYKTNPNYGYVKTDIDTGERYFFVELPIFKKHLCSVMGESDTAKLLKKLGLLDTEKGRLKKRCSIAGEPKNKQYYVVKEFSVAEIEEKILKGAFPDN